MDELNRRLSELIRSGGQALPVNRPARDSPLAASLPGGVEIGTRGERWLYRRPLEPMFHPYRPFLDRLYERAETRRQTGDQGDLGTLARGLPDRAVYLDLETCGFSGSPIFLVGLIHSIHGDWVLSQFFARTYAEEANILEGLSEIVRPTTVLVTYNGKSFDWPFVVDRLARHRLIESSPMAHVDLLHVARRRWKGVLPDCKLQTVEAAFCHRRREGDLGGKEVAVAYHEFVKTGKLTDILRTIKHNAIDLLTLFQLTPLLLEEPSAEPTADRGLP